MLNISDRIVKIIENGHRNKKISRSLQRLNSTYNPREPKFKKKKPFNGTASDNNTYLYFLIQ